MSKQKGIALFILFTIIVVYFLGEWIGWWQLFNGETDYTTAKEAYSIAASYALAGEPDAYLCSITPMGTLSVSGKSDTWWLTFYAPSKWLRLYVRNKELCIFDPKPYTPASEKEPSEAWEPWEYEIYAEKPQQVKEWVDSTVIMEDAVPRAKKDLDDPYVKFHDMVLELDYIHDYFVWEITIRSGRSGYEYIYDATDGNLIRKEPVSFIIGER